MLHHHLDALDKKILRLIAEDARIPFLEVARAPTCAEINVFRRVERLAIHY